MDTVSPMEHLKQQPAEDATSADSQPSTALIRSRLLVLQDEWDALPAGSNAKDQLSIMLEMGYGHIELEEQTEAWNIAWQAFELACEQQLWDQAVEACDILFQSEQSQALPALGQGIWLSVTFPVDPSLSVMMLEHLINETPDDADGAAVAAATACYIVDLRTKDKEREKLSFFTNQMLGKVARRHSQVETQAAFQAWIERLELNAPSEFLGRLRQVIEVLVQDDWWFNRDTLRDSLPEDA